MPPLSLRVAAPLLLALALPVPAAARAQALRLAVTEDGTGTPLVGALASVLDSGGRTVAEGITSGEGRRLLVVGAAGRYRVLVRRIGYEPFTSDPLLVGAADTLDVALRIPPRRVVLSAVRVWGETHCRGRGRGDAGAARLATLWGQISTALLVGDLTRRGRGPAGAAHRFDRRIDARAELLDIAVGPLQRTSPRPFYAVSPAELSTRGYVRQDPRDGSATYFAPDERVLLSPEFWRDHCFEVVAGRGETAGLIGMRFTPARRRRPPDIAGVLWADSATAELRHLDFWYDDESLPPEAKGPDRSGGQIVFQRLATGEWVVGAWRLRMPRFRRVERSSGPGLVHLLGYDETGGIALPPEGAPVPPLLERYLRLVAAGRVAGTVRERPGGAAVAGARVALWPLPLGSDLDIEELDERGPGTGPRAATLAITHARPLVALADEAGRFALDSVPPGRWLVEGASPAGGPAVALRRGVVTVAPGREATIALVAGPR